MPPRLSILHAPRTLVLLPKTSAPRWTLCSGNAAAMQARAYSDSAKDPRLSTKDIKERTDTDHNVHVSEEAKILAKSRGEKGPDLEQGTPVEEVVKDDQELQKHLPKVMQDALRKGDTPTGARSFSTMAIGRSTQSRSMSTSTRRSQDAKSLTPSSSPAGFEPAVIDSGLADLAPKEPRGRVRHIHNRYQNIVEQMVGLLIRSGKKGAAQRNVALILSNLRTSPPPRLDSTRLVPDHPPAAHLPLNPVVYLQVAIDSVAPILRIRQVKGILGGGLTAPIPVPLSLRRRRWEAIHWILDAAAKRKGKGSGSGMFAQKVADEIVSVVEGRSSAWQKRDALHKLAVSARANMNRPRKSRR